MYILVFMLSYFVCANAQYKVGVGIADCTGPPTQINFVGYFSLSQTSQGIHLRQFARTFIIDDGTNRTVFVSTDTLGTSLYVRKEVLTKLSTFNNGIYNERNVIISGTHTHQTPGGYFKDFLYDIIVKGFVKETFDYLVAAIVKSIHNAHENLVDARIFLKTGELLGTNFNRQPKAYRLNPEQERAKYEHDVDKTLVQLAFVRKSDNSTFGAFNWYPVHPTALDQRNRLISSDNVGYASILLEQHMNGNTFPGKGPFVGAFASTNLGDVAPISTCGEFADCTEEALLNNLKLVAEKISTKAIELLGHDGVEITGKVHFIHQYVDMSLEKYTMIRPDGTQEEIHGCLPAMGGALINDVPLLNTFLDVLSILRSEDRACHAPKKILLNTGRAFVPYQWQPRVVPTQIAMFGSVVLVAVPGEFTTMCGRRIKEAVKKVLGKNNTEVIIAGLSNIYTSYITTFEEYQFQGYEGASTIYGPHTCDLYLMQYMKLMTAIVKNRGLPPGPAPPDFPSVLFSLVPPDTFDSSGFYKKFGDCIQQPPSTVSKRETVVVKFVSGNPRHDPLHDDSFLFVERKDDDWRFVASDANWETRFLWERTNFLTGESTITINWTVPENVVPGQYRIRHKGYYKPLFGGMKLYSGQTDSFSVE